MLACDWSVLLDPLGSYIHAGMCGTQHLQKSVRWRHNTYTQASRHVCKSIRLRDTQLPFAGVQVRLIGVEAAGEGVDTDKHAATLTMGSPGVLHGSLSYLLQDSEGQVIDPHSISAG